MPAAAHFPDTVVGPLPVLRQPFQHALHGKPAILADRLAILVRKISCVHHLTVDVQLQLAESSVADTDRPRIHVAAEMIERFPWNLGLPLWPLRAPRGPLTSVCSHRR